MGHLAGCRIWPGATKTGPYRVSAGRVRVFLHPDSGALGGKATVKITPFQVCRPFPGSEMTFWVLTPGRCGPRPGAGAPARHHWTGYEHLLLALARAMAGSVGRCGISG